AGLALNSSPQAKKKINARAEQ
nr:hypothetical protein [Tanacetum cinerariifolium]